MTDVLILHGRDRASVYPETTKGRRFLKKHIDHPTLDTITVPNDLANEFAEDLKKLDPTLLIEVR